jgi:hypothetical protein
MQPQFDDLVIATHGRSIYIMDDMTPVQELPQAQTHSAWLFPIRVSYQYNTREDDEGTLTAYTGDNPPSGAIVDFYLKNAAKNAPSLQIIDEHGAVVRTISGTHEVDKKQEPYIPDKAGLNRYVWNWTSAGPVKWFGAAKKSYQGSDDGPPVPPGAYTARLTVDGQTFSRPFIVKADPRTLYTQGQIAESYRFARHGIDMLSEVDTKLNALDAVKKAIDDAEATAKKAGDAASLQKLQSIATARDSVFALFTADYHNDEDSIEMPGKVREDVQTIGFFSGTVVTPSMREFVRRAQGEVRAADAAYDRFKVEQLPTLNQTLQTLKAKPVSM